MDAGSLQEKRDRDSASASRPLRLVFVSWEYPPRFGGGIGTYVHAMARTLAARGHDVRVITLGEEPYPSREPADGVHLIRLPRPSGADRGPVGELRAWQSRAEQVAELLRMLVRAGGVDLIEFCDYRGEGATFLAQLEPAERPVCLVRLHTPSCVLNKYNPAQTRHAALEQFELEALRAADRVVSPSRALADEMRERLDPPASIDILPHPVDPAFLSAEPAEPAAESTEVLYVGRYEERKGVETLARAAAHFLERCPDAKLMMIGGDTPRGSGQPSMREVVREILPRGCRDRVELLDRIPHDRLAERYRAARLCVFPSHFENFPNTCLEAMALGKCVIGTRNSGMAEIIEDGVSGVICPARDVDALARAMIHLFQAPREVRRAMGEAARRRIGTLYHPDIIAASLELHYGEYIQAHAYRARPVAPPPSREPRVAIIVPCYNHGVFLPEALDSARAQSYPNLEIVVVDDGSTDATTLQTLEQQRAGGIRVIRQENQGLAAARNTGVRATEAPFFVPLDADDKLEPRFVERLLPALLEDAALGYSYCHARFSGALDGPWRAAAYDPHRLLVENLSVATAVVRRTAFDEADGYRTDMTYGFEDWDFWIALLGTGYHGRLLPETLFSYRKHVAGSMLDETQRHRSAMLRRMIGHHRRLFAAVLDISVSSQDEASSDETVERSKMKAAELHGGLAAAERGSNGDTSVVNELYQGLLATAELDAIENSRFWRAFRKLGTGWSALIPGEDPRRRLARVKASRTYRMIGLIKRTPMYRWCARRKYGHEELRAAE